MISCIFNLSESHSISTDSMKQKSCWFLKGSKKLGSNRVLLWPNFVLNPLQQIPVCVKSSVKNESSLLLKQPLLSPPSSLTLLPHVRERKIFLFYHLYQNDKFPNPVESTLSFNCFKNIFVVLYRLRASVKQKITQHTKTFPSLI